MYVGIQTGVNGIFHVEADAVYSSADQSSSNYFTIPTATITIDGNFDDWDAIPVAIQDLTNDVYIPSYIDIDKAYIAQDQDYLYFRIDAVENLDNVQFPCTNDVYFVFNFLFQNDTIKPLMVIDPLGVNTGEVRIWNQELSTNIMYYPVNEGFGALSGNRMEFKVLKSDMNIELNNQEVWVYSYEDCFGEATDDSSHILINDVLSTYWYKDFDSDGYGNPNQGMSASSQPSGYVSDNTDCDDTDASIHPGATEIADDGIDQDCNGIGENLIIINPDLSFSIPDALYQSLTGDLNLWLDFEFFDEQSGKLLWELVDFGDAISTGNYITISPNLSFSIPDAKYQSLLGDINLETNFEFFGEQSGKILWELESFTVK